MNASEVVISPEQKLPPFGELQEKPRPAGTEDELWNIEGRGASKHKAFVLTVVKVPQYCKNMAATNKLGCAQKLQSIAQPMR
jgi:hypothetical protein